MRSMVLWVSSRFGRNDDILCKKNIPLKRSIQIVLFGIPIGIENNALREVGSRRFLSVEKEWTKIFEPYSWFYKNLIGNKYTNTHKDTYRSLTFSVTLPHFLLSSIGSELTRRMNMKKRILRINSFRCLILYKISCTENS